MARRPARRTSSSGPPTSPLPTGPVDTDSGSVELVLDPDDPRSMTVMINGVPSSFIDLDDPTNVVFEYMEIMTAILDDRGGGPLDVVHLGAAGCTLARAIDAARPGSRQIGIDIDARLLDLARAWFDLPRSPRLRLRPGDARAQLGTLATASADVMVRDVFAGDRTPAHLCTLEFTREVLRVLRPGGLYLVNCADRPPLATARAELSTLLAAVPADAMDTGGVAVVTEPAVLKSRRYGNLVLALVAPSEEPVASLDSASLARRLRSLAVPAHVLVSRAELAGFVGQAPVLRDPVVEPSDGQDDQG